ncbi:MAG TPA: MmcQ/YjbR family DNA-binding protein [Micromonosporaceae bacterium]
MIGLDEIRRLALALPEVEEATHFGQPSFKVRGKPFAGLEKGGAHLGVGVDPAEAHGAVADDPEVYQEVWRNGSIFVGLRIDLAKVSAERVAELIERAWRNKAPKRLVTAYDEARGAAGRT